MGSNEFSSWRIRGKVVQKNRARFPSPQQLCREPESTEGFRAIEQHGIAALEILGQEFTGISTQKFHIAVGLELRFRHRSVLRKRIEFYADNLRLGEAACQDQRTFAPATAGLEDLLGSVRLNSGTKQ